MRSRSHGWRRGPHEIAACAAVQVLAYRYLAMKGWMNIQGPWKQRQQAAARQMKRRTILYFAPLIVAAALVFAPAATAPLSGRSLHSIQTEPSQQAPSTAPSLPPAYDWQHVLRIDGHLALHYSPDGAFSPDGTTLAVVGQHRVILLVLATGRGVKALHPAIQGLATLNIQSASFVAPDRLFILGYGMAKVKGNSPPYETPELGFQWDTSQDALFGKVDGICAKGGCLPPVYFPRIKNVAFYKDNAFMLWNPVTGVAGKYALPQITNAPRLFAFSPDGRWLLLAQIETSANPNPVVVSAGQHTFADVLSGHQGAVLSMTFSRDGKLLETSCEDGKVRIWSVPDWKLVETLSGNAGPAHWAEFSPDGALIASAGEDATVRIWSVTTGKLLRTLAESKQPLLTVAFSPDGQYLAATSQDEVHVWARRPVN